MSVYTTLSPIDKIQLTAIYGLSGKLCITGIAAGITNTIYKVGADEGEYCLTLFEDLSATAVMPYLRLMNFLAAQGFVCPAVITTVDGALLTTLAGKPAVLVSYLPGETVEHVTAQQCAAMGACLAQFHHLTDAYTETITNQRGSDWHQQTAQRVLPLLTPPQQRLLSAELALLQRDPLQHCSSGVIHFDGFRDNVLFVENRVTGLLDFYYACNGYRLLDIAVCINDWCVHKDGSIDRVRQQAFIDAYEVHRPLTSVESDALPAALRLAAFRFWLSRLHDSLFPASGNIVTQHDPYVFERIVLSRQSL